MTTIQDRIAALKESRFHCKYHYGNDVREWTLDYLAFHTYLESLVSKGHSILAVPKDEPYFTCNNGPQLDVVLANGGQVHFGWETWTVLDTDEK